MKAMGRRNLYDWNRWLGQRGPITLVWGVDYHCSTSAIVGQIRNHASRRGTRVRLTEGVGWVTVERKNKRAKDRRGFFVTVRG